MINTRVDVFSNKDKFPNLTPYAASEFKPRGLNLEYFFMP